MAEKDDERRCFEARTGAWPRARVFLDLRCQALELDRSPALRLELIAEELFINVAEHGSTAPGQRICLEVLDAGSEVELVIEDQGPAFNPFTDVDPPSTSSDPDARPVGRLGRTMVVGLVGRCDYKRVGDRNRVTVAVPKSAGALRRRPTPKK